jgi:hypothetical protein
VCTRGRVDRLAREHLVVGGGDGIRGHEAELHLRQPVLGVQLADPQSVGAEVAQELDDELVDGQ